MLFAASERMVLSLGFQGCCHGNLGAAKVAWSRG